MIMTTRRHTTRKKKMTATKTMMMRRKRVMSTARPRTLIVTRMQRTRPKPVRRI